MQVVLWDKIVLRGDNAVLDFKNMNTKYYFWDDGNGLRQIIVFSLILNFLNLLYVTYKLTAFRGNKNITLMLSWTVIPNAGLLPSVNAVGLHTFAFPTEYTTLRV